MTIEIKQKNKSRVKLKKVKTNYPVPTFATAMIGNVDVNNIKKGKPLKISFFEEPYEMTQGEMETLAAANKSQVNVEFMKENELKMERISWFIKNGKLEVNANFDQYFFHVIFKL